MTSRARSAVPTFIATCARHMRPASGGVPGAIGKRLLACRAYARMTGRYLTHSAPRNEETLVSAAQDGDRHAQEELLRRYEPLVRHTVRGLRCRAAAIATTLRRRRGSRWWALSAAGS